MVCTSFCNTSPFGSGCAHSMSFHPTFGWSAWPPSFTCHTSTSWEPATGALDVEDADYARSLVESLTHPWAPMPSYDQVAHVGHLASEPERLKAIVSTLKARLASGGEYAVRALCFLHELPADSLADMVGEIKKVADPTSGLTSTIWHDCPVRNTAEWYARQAESAKAERDEAAKRHKWDTWSSLYGRSSVAWLAPPDDSAYAYPKMPIIESPKNPDGFRWVLLPARAMRHFESGGVYPWHR